MVIIARKVGRLANRIMLFAHFIGAAREHGFNVVNPAFDHYASYFPAMSRDLFCRYPPADPFVSLGFAGRSVLYRLVLYTTNALHALQRLGLDTGVIRLRRDQVLDLDGPAFLSSLGRHRILLVQDWFFRSASDCEKHGDAIRSFFTPWKRHLEKSRALVEPARRNGSFLVGVHVRQDDYRTFKDGRYFYSHRQYRNLMEQVRSVYPDRPVSFLVCSDDPVPADAFSGFDVLYGNGHELEDLYALASCDLLMGPPSTYSRWASFYGKVPRLEIADPEVDVRPEQFRVERRLVNKSLFTGLTEWQDPRA
jgi:hypothetical protein